MDGIYHTRRQKGVMLAQRRDEVVAVGRPRAAVPAQASLENEKQKNLDSSFHVAELIISDQAVFDADLFYLDATSEC